MAITVDQASLAPTAGSTGTGSAGTVQTNHTFSTSAEVASGAMIVLLVHRWRSGGGGTYTGTGGSLTWTTVHTVTSGNVGIYLICAFAPSGLAASTTIGVNGSVGSNDYTVTAASYLGVDTSGTVSDAVRAFGGAAAGTAAWGTGTIGGSAGDAYIGGCGGDGTLRTSTPDAGTERNDFNSATSSGSNTLIDKLSGSADDSLDGDWSGTLTHVAIGAAFIPASGASAVSASRALSYDIINAVAAARGLSYDVINAILAARGLSYDIVSAAAVSTSRGLSYDVLNAVLASRGLSYDIINSLLAARGLSYDILGSVLAARGLSYDVLNAVIAACALSYDVSNQASNSVRLYYDLGDVIVATVVELVSTQRGVWQPDVYTIGRHR